MQQESLVARLKSITASQPISELRSHRCSEVYSTRYRQGQRVGFRRPTLLCQDLPGCTVILCRAPRDCHRTGLFIARTLLLLVVVSAARVRTFRGWRCCVWRRQRTGTSARYR